MAVFRNKGVGSNQPAATRREGYDSTGVPGDFTVPDALYDHGLAQFDGGSVTVVMTHPGIKAGVTAYMTPSGATTGTPPNETARIRTDAIVNVGSGIAIFKRSSGSVVDEQFNWHVEGL